VRRYAESLLERAREVSLGHVAHLCQPPDGPVLLGGGVHAVFRAQQPTQQLGVLAYSRELRIRLGFRALHTAKHCESQIRHPTCLS
jgi:hypothetical protein